MELSPGTLVVWSLAAREAVLAQMEKVTPEHFFCALLKFAEISVSELTDLAKQAQLESASVELGRDQRQVVEAVQNMNLNSLEVRRAVRSEIGKGTYQHSGEMLHRTEESRQLFERAAGRALAANEPLRPIYIFEELFENPTPLLAKFIKSKQAAAPKPPPRPKPAASEKPAVTVGDLGQEAIGQDSQDDRSAEAQVPQIKTLSWAMDRPSPAHLLLYCAPGLDVESILEGAYLESEKCQTLLKVTFSHPAQAGASNIRETLQDNSEEEGAFILLNMSNLKADDARQASDTLLYAFRSEKPRLALAIPEALENDPEFENKFADVCRLIWLHDLTQAFSIKQV